MIATQPHAAHEISITAPGYGEQRIGRATQLAQPRMLSHGRGDKVERVDDRPSEIPKHVPQNRRHAGSKLRRDRKHCPVCLAALKKNAPRTRLRKMCDSCQGHPSPEKKCSRCASHEVWENKDTAACQACGSHGVKSVVIAE